MTRQWQDNDNKHDKKKDKNHNCLANFIFLEFQHLLSFSVVFYVMFLSCFIVFLYVFMILVCDVSCLTVLFFSNSLIFVDFFLQFLLFFVTFPWVSSLFFCVGFLHVFIGFLLLCQMFSLFFLWFLIDLSMVLLL